MTKSGLVTTGRSVRAVVPVMALLVLFGVWELSGRRWDPVRVAMPVVLGVGVFRVFKVRRWRARAVWSVAVVSFLAISGVVRQSALGDVTVTWLHDGRALLGTTVLLIMMLWTVRAFEHHRRWQTWMDIANVAVVFAAAGALWESSGSGPTPYPWMLGWLTVAVSSAAAALGVVLLGPEVGWNGSARWLLAGVLCGTATRVAFLSAARNGWDEVWLSWGWCLAAALVGCAVWHPDASSLQVRRGALRRTRRGLSLIAAVLVLVVGYSLLVVAELSSAVLWVGVVGVALTWLRAVLALRVSWQMRLNAELALSREREARDAEQRALQRVVYRDVSQLLSAASWLVEDGEPRSLLQQAEEASLQVLHGFRPNVPSIEEIPGALAEVLERFPAGPAWSFEVTSETSEPHQSVVWGVVREAAVNVMKHAQAQNAAVRIACLPGGCSVVVEDDGVGIKNRMNGVGLSNLKTLVGTVGGTITATEREAGGTRVEATLPGSGAL